MKRRWKNWSLLAAICLFLTATAQADPRNYGGAGGLRLWLDASDSSTLFQNVAGTTAAGVGNPVNRWNDKSGQGNDFSGASSGITLGGGTIGGQNAINFNNTGLTSGLSDATGIGIANGDARTMFFMMNYSNGATRLSNELFGSNTGNMVDFGTNIRTRRLRTRNNDGGSDLGAYSGANSVPDGSNLVSLTSRAVAAGAGVSGERNGLQLGFSTYLVNTPSATPTITTGQYQHYNATAPMLLAGSNVSNRAYIGNVGEVLVYNSTLNAAELSLVNNYTSAKYSGAGAGAVPLSAGRDFYRGDDAAFGNFDFNVFGIGRANAVGLNPAGAVTVDDFGRGLQLSELNNSLNDGEFVLAGDRNTANTIVTTLLPAGVDERWSRTWFVDPNTGGVDLRMTFDFADASDTWDANNQYSLLIAQTDGGPFTLANVSAYSSSPGFVSFDLTGANAVSTFGYFTIGATATPEPATLALWLLLGLVTASITPRLAKGLRK